MQVIMSEQHACSTICLIELLTPAASAPPHLLLSGAVVKLLTNRRVMASLLQAYNAMLPLMAPACCLLLLHDIHRPAIPANCTFCCACMYNLQLRLLVPAGAKPGARRQKGQTLAEWEAAEGGPVKESMVGMAAVKRALRRKQQRGEQES
jgi:hypothetical protein